MQSFDVYFLGEMLPDADPQAVRQGVARLFKVREETVDRLFSGKPLRVKQAIDADSASRYRAAFREVGALLQVVPAGAPAPAPRAPSKEPQPPVSAPTAKPQPAAAGPVAAATLAEPGATIDDTPPPPPAQIDTSGLEALPPNTGSLEDCKVEKPHRPIPDIGHLKLVDD